MVFWEDDYIPIFYEHMHWTRLREFFHLLRQFDFQSLFWSKEFFGLNEVQLFIHDNVYPCQKYGQAVFVLYPLVTISRLIFSDNSQNVTGEMKSYLFSKI